MTSELLRPDPTIGALGPEAPRDYRPYRVAFTHIPKVAGTSAMRRLVRANYRFDEIREFRGTRDLLFSRPQFRVLVGHNVYGMHHFIPGEVKYFTILRDPIQRAISHYYFIRQSSENPNFTGNAAQAELHNAVSIEEIFEVTKLKKRRLMGTWLVDNMQTRYIAGWPHYWRSENSEELLHAAKRNLRDRYAAFGIQENFEQSLNLIANEFEWVIAPDKGDRPKQTHKKPQLEDAEQTALRKWHLLDYELYDYALELLRKRGMTS